MPKTQYEALELAIKANFPVILWGEPGIGKTATVNGMVRKVNGYMYTFIASQRDPVDLTGAMHPAIRDGVPVTRYSPPEWAVDLNERARADQFCVLFLDEFSTAPALMQAACLRLLHEKMVGDYPLDPRVRIILAANPAEVAAYGHDLAPPTANRIIHLEWTLTADEWAHGILYNEWIPTLRNEKAEEILRSDVLPKMAAYVQRTGHLNVRPKSDSEAGRAWPSGRTWAMAASLIAEAMANGKSGDIAGTLLVGAIGPAIGHEYLAYVRELDLPDPEMLLADPDKYPLPTRQDQVFATLGSVIARVATKDGFTKERNIAAWKILFRVADKKGNNQVDLAAAHANVLAKYCYAHSNGHKYLADAEQYTKPFDKMFALAAGQEVADE